METFLPRKGYQAEVLRPAAFRIHNMQVLALLNMTNRPAWAKRWAIVYLAGLVLFTWQGFRVSSFRFVCTLHLAALLVQRIAFAL